MRGHVPTYEIIAPRTFKEVLDHLHSDPNRWRLFAGGTDLMVLFEAGQLEHKNFISLWGFDELRGIEETPHKISIGALTTYSEILKHPTILKEFPMLSLAASETGAVAIQNRGTLGGNIANASPAADSPPALLAYDAEVELVSSVGTRRVAYSSFHTAYKKTVMRPDELISKIHLRREDRGFHYYRKVGTRRAQAISKVCFSGVLAQHEGIIKSVRISLGSVAATPIRCLRIESALLNQKMSPSLMPGLRQLLSTEIKPLNDIRSTAEYRLRVAGNLLEDFLTRAQTRRL